MGDLYLVMKAPSDPLTHRLTNGVESPSSGIVHVYMHIDNFAHISMDA